MGSAGALSASEGPSPSTPPRGVYAPRPAKPRGVVRRNHRGYSAARSPRPPTASRRVRGRRPHHRRVNAYNGRVAAIEISRSRTMSRPVQVAPAHRLQEAPRSQGRRQGPGPHPRRVPGQVGPPVSPQLSTFGSTACNPPTSCPPSSTVPCQLHARRNGPGDGGTSMADTPAGPNGEPSSPPGAHNGDRRLAPCPASTSLNPRA